MRILSDLWFRFRALFWGGRMDEEFLEEAAFHMEMETKESIRNGMSPKEARRQAQIAFGGVETHRERAREARGVRLAEELCQDLRFAIRSLRRRPAYSVFVILTVALGIGGISATFTLINGVFLRPLPYEGADQLVMVWNTDAEPEPFELTSADFLDWREQAQSFSDFSAYVPSGSILERDLGAEMVTTVRVTPGFFTLLRVDPALGLGFLPRHGIPGSDPVVMLSQSAWLTRFGGDPAVLEQNLSIDGEVHRVVGVLPPSFRAPIPGIGREGPELWVPIQLDAATAIRESHHLKVLGRLADGVSLNEAGAELVGVARQLELAYPETNAGESAVIIPLRDQHYGATKAPILMAFGAAVLLMLIVCANLANLVLAHGETRRREFAIRTSIGAGSIRLLRLLIVENLVLALSGGLMGFGLVVAGGLLLPALQRSFLSPVADIRIDIQVGAFLLVSAVLVGVFFGLLPLVGWRRVRIQAALKQHSCASGTGLSTQFWRRGLVVIQICLAVGLSVNAGLLVRSLQALTRVPPGLELDSALTFSVLAPWFRYSDREARSAFFEQLGEVLSRVPGVDAAALTSDLPFQAVNSYNRFVFEDEIPPEDTRPPLVEYRSVGPGLFRVLGIGVLEGREFESSDRSTSPLVAIINEEMAKGFQGVGSPVGRILAQVISPDRTTRARIVGIVANVMDDGYGGGVEPAVYFPFAQRPVSGMTAIVRSTHGAPAIVPVLREAVANFEPQAPIGPPRTLREVAAASLSTQRLAARLGAIVAFLATLLSGIGVFGLVRLMATNRRREFGLRVALGANGTDLFRMVLRWCLPLTLLGVSAGVLFGLFSTRVLSSMLFGVDPLDPLSFSAAAFLLTLVSLLAAVLPARTAMRSEPVEVLKEF